MDWEPTTITAGLPRIWQAVRTACSSWSRRISCLLEDGLALAFGEQPAQGGYLAHLDGVAVEAGQDAVQAEHVAVVGQLAPAVEVAGVRLAGDAAAEPLEVAVDDRAPLLEAVRGQADGKAAVEPPGAPLEKCSKRPA